MIQIYIPEIKPTTPPSMVSTASHTTETVLEALSIENAKLPLAPATILPVIENI